MLAGLKLGERISEMGSLGRDIYFRGVKIGITARWCGQNRVAVIMDQEVWTSDLGFMGEPVVRLTDTILLTVEDFVGSSNWRFEQTEDDKRREEWRTGSKYFSQQETV